MRITGYSTARLATWYFLDELKLLFDAGDGAAAAIGSKCQRVEHVFISHADRDHLGGLVQFNQLAARRDRPLTYYYPKDSGSFPAMRDFLERFDPNLPKADWVPVQAGDRIDIGKNHVVDIGENAHLAVVNPANRGLTKSLDFRVLETRRHLKPEFQSLPGAEIGDLRKRLGNDHITDVVDYPVFGFSGDTPSFDSARWAGTRVLAHEATFIAPDSADRGHCELDDVLRGASSLDIEALILGHFSSRYHADAIRQAITREAEATGVAFPIYAVMPMEISADILATDPVWPGTLSGTWTPRVPTSRGSRPASG